MANPNMRFRPLGPTVKIAATTANAQQTIGKGNRIRVANPGTVAVFFAYGPAAQTASITTSMPILPGTVETFECTTEDTFLAGITISGSADLYVTPGEGV